MGEIFKRLQNIYLIFTFSLNKTLSFVYLLPFSRNLGTLTYIMFAYFLRSVLKLKAMAPITK